MILKFSNFIDPRTYIFSLRTRIRRFHVLHAIVTFISALCCLAYLYLCLVMGFFDEDIWFLRNCWILIISLIVFVCVEDIYSDEQIILKRMKKPEFGDRRNFIHMLEALSNLYYVDTKLCRMLLVPMWADGEEYCCYVTLSRASEKYDIEVTFPSTMHEAIRIRKVPGYGLNANSRIVAQDNELYIGEGTAF